MEEVQCQQCRMVNPATSAFCSRCGAALAASSDASGGASGWELATAGMAQPPAVDARGGPLRKEEFAGWWQRLGGSFLDGLIFVAFVAAVYGVLALLTWAVAPDAISDLGDWLADEGAYDPYGGTAAGSGDPPDSVMALFGAAVVVFLALTLGWETYWTRSRHMAKPGQSVAGFRVVRVDELERVSTRRALGRAAAKLLYNIPNLGGLLTLATAFTIGLSGKKQAIHDMVAGTACVRKSTLGQRGVGPDAEQVGTGLPGGHQQHMPPRLDAAPPPSPAGTGPHPGSGSGPGSGPFV